MGRKILLIIGFCTFQLTIKAQTTFMPSDEDFYHLLDRYSILNAKELNFSTSTKPFGRVQINSIQTKMVDYFSWASIELSKTDLYNREVFANESWEINNGPGATPKANSTTILGKSFPNIYRYRGSFFSVDQSDFKLVVNPVLAFDMGKDQESGETVYRNTRGAEMRGSIGNKIGFYTFISENQVRYPAYYNNWITQTNVVPGAGYVKDFKGNARDYFVSRGYITASPIKEIQVQFGHDRNFIGNGYRSLIMSDFAKENLFLKLRTQVWRLTYTNLFSEYTDYHSRNAKTGLKKKYGAFHYLSLNVKPGVLDIGFFEHIMFYRESQRYETQYLNPIIFYRSVEHGLNSSDNAILGADIKWNPAKKVSLYGQLVLDEFNKNALVNRTGSWVNKWAIQSGAKWINAFNISNLDLQVEANVVRPYTYTHLQVSQSYTHYNQAIAHPLGSNFKEVLAIVRYQPKPKWSLVFKVFNIIQGLDSSNTDPTTHYGGDLLKDYESRPKDVGIKIGDGVRQSLQIADACVSYQIYHRTFLDLRMVYRDSKIAAGGPKSSSTTLFYFGFRMNIAKMNFDF